ncbi:MAG: hypothetical protein Q4F66_09375 [Clostridium sp.]|nr:hypothetical protein [Clostridium sp.]
MSLLNVAENLIFNIRENNNKKIYSIFNDYEEYIKREKELLKHEASQDKQLSIILNIAEAYFSGGNYKKAIKMINILDDYELNDEMTFIYYVNSVTYYIYNNDEQSADYLYDQSKAIMKKYDRRYPEVIDLYTIRYLNFKGRYEESLKILNRNRIKNKNSDDYNLLIADIAFNTDEIDEGSFIISEMCRTYYKKEPCIQNQINILINTYIKNADIEKYGQDTDVSFENKMWDKVKDSKIKTSLFYAYIELKKLFKKKWFLYVVLPFIVTMFFCRVIMVLILGDIFSDILINIIEFLFLIYLLFGFGYITMKHTQKCSNGIIPAIVITFIVVSFLMGFYVSDFTNNVLDLKYAVTRTDLNDTGFIQAIKIKTGSKGPIMKIKINNKLFSIHEDEKLYDYINNNFKEGYKVYIEYLPHTMKLVNIERE